MRTALLFLMCVSGFVLAQNESVFEQERLSLQKEAELIQEDYQHLINRLTERSEASPYLAEYFGPTLEMLKTQVVHNVGPYTARAQALSKAHSAYVESVAWMKLTEFPGDFFVSSLEKCTALGEALIELEKTVAIRQSLAEATLRGQMLKLVCFTLEKALLALSDEKQTELKKNHPAAALLLFVQAEIKAARKEAVKAAEEGQSNFERFRQTELFCRPELYLEAEKMLKMLYRAQLVKSNSDQLLLDAMWKVAEIVAQRTWFGLKANNLSLAEANLSYREADLSGGDPAMRVYLTCSGLVKAAKKDFENYEASLSQAEYFLTEQTLVDEPLASAALQVIIVLQNNRLPGPLHQNVAKSLMRKATEKVLTQNALDPDLYLAGLYSDDFRMFAKGCIQVVEKVSRKEMEPNWRDANIALNALEEAYRWYSYNARLQAMVAETKAEVQRYVSDVGNTPLPVILLERVVFVVKCYQSEKAFLLKQKSD